MTQQARPIVLQGQIVWRPSAPSSAISVQTWEEVEQAIANTEGFLTVFVDSPGVPAQIPATATTDCTRVVFEAYAPQIENSPPIIEIVDGGYIRNPARFVNCTVRGAPTAQPGIVLDINALVCEFVGNALLQLSGGAAAPLLRMAGDGQQISFLDGATVANDTGNFSLGVIECPSDNGYSVLFIAQGNFGGPPQVPNNTFQGANPDAELSWFSDASCAPVFQTAFAGGLSWGPMDWAKGVCYNDNVVSPQLGAQNVQDAIDALKSLVTLPELHNYCYVSPTGNDLTANGSVQKPFATVAAAMASITTASPTSRWAIVVTGRVNDTLPIALKANVYIVGYSPVQSRCTSPAWSLDPTSWTPAGDHRGGFINITVAGSLVPIDFNAVSSNEGKFYCTGAWINAGMTCTAFSLISQFSMQACRTFATTTFNGGQIQLAENDFDAPVVLNEGPGFPAEDRYQYESHDNTYDGGLTINYVASDSQVSLADIISELTINGPINVSATVDSVTATPTLTGGATLTLLSAARGVGYDDGAVSPPLNADNVQAAIDALKQRPINTIIWRPGGTSAPGVYNTWAGVAGAITAAQGNVTVLVDTSLGAAVINTVQDCFGRTWFKSYTPKAANAPLDLQIIDPGALLDPAGFDNLHVFAAPIDAFVPIQIGNDNGSLVFTNYAFLERQPEGNTPFITSTGGGIPQIAFLQGAAAADDGEGPTTGLIQIASHPGSLRLIVQNQLGLYLLPDTLIEGGATDTLNLNFDASAQAPDSFSLFAGTLNLLPEDLAGGVSNPLPPAPLTSTDVAGQIFQIVTFLGRLGTGTTGDRPPPDPTTAGWYYFDTTLGKPVWSTGAGYVDATGAPA